MKFWKRFGWFMLGLLPGVTVMFWQMLVSVIGVIIYSLYRNITAAGQGIDTSSEEFLNSINEGFMTGTSYSIIMIVVYIGYLVIFGLWFWLMFCWKKQTGDWKQVLKPQRIGGIVGCGIALQIAISMFLTVILPLFPKIFESYSGVMEALGSDSVLMIICVCLLAPIGEELIFRGLTFRIMKKAVPWQAALIVQAVLFGVYHLNLVQGIYAALLGLLLGYLAHRYGSVVPGILLHIAVNTSSYLVGYLLPESLQEKTVLMLVIGIVAFAAAAAFTYLITKNVKPTEVNPTEPQSIPAN